MLLDLGAVAKQHDIGIKGIIQLGTHYFQEKNDFLNIGVSKFVLVEPQKQAFFVAKEAAKDVNAIMFNCAVSYYNGESEMNCDVVNEGQSSSLLKPKDHLLMYPQIQFPRKETVEVCKLDDLAFDRTEYNCIVADLQGGELNAFIGGIQTLPYIDVIYTEVNTAELYEGCVLLKDLDEFLLSFDLKRVAISTNKQCWGDAIYIKI
jgi:FkbM family methyltransferase